MRELLEKLFNGDFSPAEHSVLKDSALAEEMQIVTRSEQRLLPLLNKESKDRFEKYIEASSAVARMYEEEAFVSGFRAGARLLIEVLGKNDGCFTDSD